jgi:hypothetical protein
MRATHRGQSQPLVKLNASASLVAGTGKSTQRGARLDRQFERELSDYRQAQIAR